MSPEEIKSIVATLARSQGFYGRLYRDIDEEDRWGELAEAATKAGCKSQLDFILWIEC